MAGYLHTQGKTIVDSDGNVVLLRGVGLGNWLLPEGYMWKFFNKCDRPRRIEALIEDLTDKTKAVSFWQQFRENYTTEEDIIRIKEEGFNSIRLPFNYRVIYDCDTKSLIPAGIHWIDLAVEWCERHEIYIILDLHGAPGGQTGANIDDSENDQPGLFIDTENEEHTIILWRALAERYKDKEIIAGYDLLNEPLPEWFKMYNPKVMPLYRKIANAIREVDQHHMIILEGVHWSTDFDIFDELKTIPFDNNYMLQFHKYWNHPDIESIQKFLDYREILNIPLFMGESGENNNAWYTGAFHMYEQLGISWNFWVWKKMAAPNSPCSVKMPKHWNLLLEYIDGGDKPDAQKSWEILGEYLSNIPINQCEYNLDVCNHLLRRVPLQIPAVYYDYLGPVASFQIHQPIEREGLRRLDYSGIYKVDEAKELDFSFNNKEREQLYLAVQCNEWFKYTFNNSKKCEVTLSIKMKLAKDSKLNIHFGKEVYEMYNEYEVWQEIVIGTTRIEKGEQIIQLIMCSGHGEFQWLELK